MKADKRVSWLLWMSMLIAVVACLGLAGCDDGGGGDDGETTVVVVTNETTGVVTTNVVVVVDDDGADDDADIDDADADADADGDEEPAILDVAGTWTGNFSGQDGQGQIQVSVIQDGMTVHVQGRVNTGGPDRLVTSQGTIQGDLLGMTLLFEDNAGDFMVLAGNVNASSTSWEGQFNAQFNDNEDTGSFTMHK